MAIDLWSHQKEHGSKLRDGEISALWWVMRTGKTLTAIEGSDDGDRLIICPNSVKPVWHRDLALYGQDSYIWDKKKPKERPRNVIVNYESLWRTPLLDWGYDTIIFDESHRIANFRTKLYRYLIQHHQELCSSRVILLSGTPCAEGWHQLIGQAIVAQGSYNGFTDPWEALRDGWTYDEDSYKWIPNRGTEALAKTIMHGMGTTMTQAQAGINTKKLYRLVQIPAGKHEEALWKAALAEPLDGAQYGLVAQSCASGRHPDTATTEHSAKLDAVVEYAQELGKPCVILTRFTESLNCLTKKLKELGIKTEAIHGDDDGSKYRGEVIERFNAGKTQIIVANVMTVKVGLNLSHSDTLIFAENSFSGEARIQAEERATVRGKDAVEIIDFCTVSELEGLGDVDFQVLTAVRDKKDFNSNSLRRPQ